MKQREYSAKEKSIRNLIIISLFFALPSTGIAQGVFESTGNGSWDLASTWALVAGSDADGIPDTNDAVTIKTGHTITVGATAGDCAQILVQAGGTVQLTGAGDVRVTAPGSAAINGSLVLSSTGTLRKQGTLADTLFAGDGGKITVSGAAVDPTMDVYRLDRNSTFEYARVGAQNVKANVLFGNLTLAGSGTKTVTPIPVDTAFRCAGTLTVGTGVTFDVSTNILRIYFDGNVNINGTVDASVGITVLWMTGANWINNGSYLPATSLTGFGYTAVTTFTNATISGTPVAQSFYDLAIAGTVNAQTNLIAKRNITIGTGATLNAGTGTSHSLKGNWTNSGTFNSGTSTVTFNDTSAAQSIGASTFYNLALNNPKGATLAGNIAIAPGGTLTLANGTLSTGTRTLTVNSTDPAAIVFGTNAITGTVVRSIAAGSTGTYGLFGANSYVVPGGTDNPTSITATVFPGTNPPNLPPTADTNMIAKRYATITSAGQGPGFTYTLRLSYLQSEVRGNEANYGLWSYDGSGWTNMGAVLQDPAANYVQQAGMTGFSTWAIAENSAPLPVQLVTFSAAQVASRQDVTLAWSTASEMNNLGFYIERRTEADHSFAGLQNIFIPGHGTSLQQHSYSWTEKNVAPGTYYYRLKQVDLDGSTHYSEAVKVEVQGQSESTSANAPEAFSLHQNYPNPCNPTTEIQFTVASPGKASVRLYNAIGQLVSTLFDDFAEPGRYYSVRMDGSSLASGMYLYRLDSNGQVDMKKLVLMK